MKRTAYFFLLAACGGAHGGGPDASLGDPDTHVGTFEIELVAPAEGTPYASVTGAVTDVPTPPPIVWEEAAAAGDCVLVTPRIPFCSAGCAGDEVCVEDDTCAPYATKQDVGVVTVHGLGDDFDLTLIAGIYQVPASVDLAYPPFGEGDAIGLDASGSDFNGAFAVDATGIAPFALTSDDLALARDTALALSWTPPADDAVSRVLVELDISHHGGTRGAVECDASDSGSLDIDGTLITQLLDLGAAGFPTIIVSRRATGSTVISAGRVDLHVVSEVEVSVSVPGIQSCTEDNDCPDGQVCRDDLTCGE